MSRILQPCGYESRHQTFSKPLQLPRHCREEHEETVTPVEEVRPIRLRLSQPKRQNPESLEDSPRKGLLILLPTKQTLSGTSTSDPTEAQEHCSESKSFAKRPTIRIKGGNGHDNACPSNSSFSTRSTSDASGKCQVSSHGSKITPTAAPRIPTPNVRPLAPISQLTVSLRSAEHKDYRSCTDGQSSRTDTTVYTKACGVYSKEKASPKKVRTNGGRHHCPRCDTQFTRARGVKGHFVGCITKYGNPDRLKWTDHPSLEGTVKFYARSGHQRQENVFVPQAADLHRNEKKSSSLVLKPLSTIVEENSGSVEPVYTPPRQDVLQQKDIVQPIHKRRDALRRSKYNAETIARDVLLAMGSHPVMDPLNAHLDILRKRSRVVNLESNMSTFRWDLVDPEQEAQQGPERQAEEEEEEEEEEEAEPEQSAPKASEAEGDTEESEFNNAQWYYDASSSLSSQSSTETGVFHHEVPFRVVLPEKTHFGPMSTIFASVFDRDPSARLMSSNGDLWAAIFTMLERGYHERDFVLHAAVRESTGDVVGWVACQEVDAHQARPVDPSAYLDWTTAAHVLPSQISRFTTTKESAKEKAEHSKQRKVGQGLASTIQARATEAQMYLVPIGRLVINALVVHPLHQGRGVASALLNSITEIADMRKRPIWVQAPEDPAVAQGALKEGLFRRAGFTCAGELNLDLDSYASGSRQCDKGKGVSLGTYKWNYMLRLPQPVKDREQGRTKIALLDDPTPKARADNPSRNNVPGGGAVLDPGWFGFHPSNGEPAPGGKHFSALLSAVLQ
ncbi:hypothetical protein HO133_004407 [Letharia lupina]|uniref:N-acetyltransferase domain-containing protein n=1 Tax=Letharia lupina TaxID=560253 RepID=A0A8H6KZM6_9LECA|nr:uncharacterized protein HO133_004407 [Letharia lupina]KAF6230068.1 hypothetical protein HO133_004407 [Letharia lupina]